MAAGDPTNIKLGIYIDQALLKQDPTTGLPNLGKLTVARNVAGKTNVVFQSRSPSDFGDYNDFGWQQAYQIEAYKQLPTSGAMVRP